MPIYEYRCSACGHELESLQKLRDAPLVTCPACGAETLVKKVSAAGFQLKGSGWYATDFRNAGKPPAKVDKQAGAEATGGEGAKASGAEASDGGKPAAESSGGEAKGGEANGGDAKPSEAKPDAKPSAPAPSSTSAAPAASGTKPA